MIAWIWLTSGRMALRVRTMCLLQCSQALAGLFQSLPHAMGRGPARHVMASQHGLKFEMVVNVSGKNRAELLQLFQCEILQLAIPRHALLHRMGDNLMCLAEGDCVFSEISCGGHRIHETTFTRRPHALCIEQSLAHESGGDSHTKTGSCSRIEQWLLGLLQVFVVSQRKAFYQSKQSYLVADQPRRFAANQFQRVRVLFLRHGTAASGISFRQADEAVLLRGKQNELFFPAAQMYAEQRKGIDELNGKIAVAGCVDAVGRGPIELQMPAYQFAVQCQRRSRDGS